MNETPSISDNPLPPELARRVDQVCNRFEAAWRAGQVPRVEDFLTGWEGSDRSALERELLLLEGHYRRGRAVDTGATPATGDDTAVVRPGRTVGDYELLEEIARGGMGVVFKARQVSLNRVVAVKMILAGQLASAADVQRFLTEAENAAGLDHPHIVPIHEVGEHDGQHFFAMKLIEGGNLAQHRERFADDPRRAAELMRDVAEAVHHAHQRGILHRDLKPGNILLDAEGQPHVTDFGLAKRLQGGAGPSHSGAVIGTPSYMAPEQAAGRNKQLTTAADVYGLGAVLYELLAGRPPFVAETPLDTLLQVVGREPVPPSRIAAQVPRDLETICLKCLSKEPSHRYGSAEEVARELERFLSDEPITARRASLLERGVKWARRHPAWAALGGVAAVASVALVGIVVAVAYNAHLGSMNAQLLNTKEQLEEANQQLQSTFDELQEKKRDAERQRARAREEEAKARRYLYVARMTLVQKAVQDNQPARVVELLRSVVPESPGQEDLRDWEWHHLWRKYHGEQARLHGHTGPVTAVAFGKDASLLASASADQTVRLWDADSGKELLTLDGHEDRVTSVAFSPDGKRLASGCADSRVKLWDVDTGRELYTLRRHKDRVNGVAFSPDGRHLATACEDGSVIVWDAQAGKRTAEFKEDGAAVRAVAFSPDGVHIASASKNGTKLWKWATGEFVTVLSPAEPSVSLAFSPDGKRLATVGVSPTVRPERRRIKVWDVEGNKAAVDCKWLDVTLTQVAYSPDGKRLAASGLDRTVRVWDAGSGHETAALHAGDAAQSVAFSADGSRIASGTEDHSIVVWSAPGTETRSLRQGRGHVTSVAFNPNGSCLAGVCGDRAIIWDAITGRELHRFPASRGASSRLAWSPDGACLAGVSTDELTDAVTGKPRLALQRPTTPRLVNNGSLGAAFSPDGRYVAQAWGGEVAWLWDAVTGRLIRSFEVPNWASCVAFSPDGKFLAAGSGFDQVEGAKVGSLQVLEVSTGRPACPLIALPLNVWGLAFSPDGKLLAAAMGYYEDTVPNLGTVRVWDTATWRVVHEFRGHSGCAWSVAFAPGGTRLASAGGKRLPPGEEPGPDEPGGGEVILWDLRTGQEVGRLQDTAENGILGVAFNPDGRWLATAHNNGAVLLRDGTRLAETPPYRPLPEDK